MPHTKGASHMMQLLRRSTLTLLVLILSAAGVQAQDAAPSLTMTAEQDIGFDCPIAAAAQPDTDVFWVLMNSCGDRRFSLHAYDLKTGAPLEREPIPLEKIDGAVAYMYASSIPMGFAADGQLEIYSFDADTYDRITTRVDVESGAVTTGAEADKQADRLVRQVSEYPEQAIYSPNRAFAAAADENKVHVIDMLNAKVLFDVAASYGLSIFSPDSRSVYISVFDEPDNSDNPNATVTAYTLPDGKKTRSVHLPSGFVYPSPDGRFLAAQIDESKLAVVDVASGQVSDTLEMWEPEGKAMKCENDGRSLSDVDFTKDGRLQLVAVQWLPDSSGFYTLNTYGGDAVGGGRVCYLDHSRLRQYIIGDV